MAEAATSKRPISGWVIILMISVFGFGVVFAAYMARRQPPSAPRKPPLGEVTLEDGTILVLEDVTFGRSHSFAYPDDEPRGYSLFSGNSPPNSDSESTSNDAFMIWMSRRDPATGRSMHLEFWKQTVAIDENGREVPDTNAGLRTRSRGGGGGSMSGSRPFTGNFAANPDQFVVAHSELPPFRQKGPTFKLKVYNNSRKVVAEFDVPHPAPVDYPVWQPEPLPATKTDGDLEVTLKSLTAARAERNDNGHSIPVLNVQLTLEIKQNGAPTTIWQSYAHAVDALGNSDNLWNCRLSPFEAAWKLQLTLYRSETAPFDANEKWTVPVVLPPEANQNLSLTDSATLNGVLISLVSIGGSGTVTYLEAAPPNQGGSYGSGGSAGGQSFQIDSKVEHGRSTTTVQCGLPHLRMRPATTPLLHFINVRIVDDQQREVKVTETVNRDVRYYFLEIPAGAKGLTATVIVQKARTVEFLVKPPVPEEVKPGA